MNAETSYDLLVVGAGVLGLAHAAAAADRGLRVLVIDRDEHAVGASVRNFGHCCITAQTGELLELARAARERWLKLSAAAGVWSVASGGLAVACSAVELGVLEELAAERDGEVRLVTAREVQDMLGGAVDPATVGGAVLTEDVRVDPRTAVPGIAGWLEQHSLVDIAWRTAYWGPESSGIARTSRGPISAARTIVCVGHDIDHLFPDVAEDVERCALQMALVDPPAGTVIEPAVLSATSMLRYPAFSSTSAAAALRTELEATRPDLLDIDANLMLTQRPNGSLLVGDSHLVRRTADPFLDETTSTTLLSRAAQLLGTSGFTIRQRWQGVYASSAQRPYLVADIAADVTAVTVTTGIGMTISFGLAEQVLQRIAG